MGSSKSTSETFLQTTHSYHINVVLKIPFFLENKTFSRRKCKFQAFFLVLGFRILHFMNSTVERIKACIAKDLPGITKYDVEITFLSNTKVIHTIQHIFVMVANTQVQTF